MSPLAALLNLLTCLSCSLPSFTTSLLTDNGDDSDIIGILCAVIRDHLEPAKHADSALGHGIVALLEGLCWNVKDDLICRWAHSTRPWTSIEHYQAGNILQG
jgi:hypothetical protein